MNSDDTWCTCGEPAEVHNIGTRKGVKVRTYCTRLSGPHATPCECRMCTPVEGCVQPEADR